MFGTVRRFAASQVLRATAPRSVSARSIPQLQKWQSPLTLSSVVATRSLHSSYPRLSAVPAEAFEEVLESSRPEAPTAEFAQLASDNIIDGTLIKNIVHADRMGLKTMTEVQFLTLHEIVKGDDM
jgi:ATP-dependent RNA helicase MSS116